MQTTVMQKNDAAKVNPQYFVWIYFCKNSFYVKSFGAKNLCITIFCLFVFVTVYSVAYVFVYLIKMTISLNMKKNIAQIRIHKRRSKPDQQLNQVNTVLSQIHNRSKLHSHIVPDIKFVFRNWARCWLKVAAQVSSNRKVAADMLVARVQS